MLNGTINIVVAVILMIVAGGVGLFVGAVCQMNRIDKLNDRINNLITTNEYDRKEVQRLYHLVDDMTEQNEKDTLEIADLTDKLHKASSTISAMKENYLLTVDNMKAQVDEIHTCVVRKVTKLVDEHDEELHCNNCYWKALMDRERDRLLEALRNKDAIIASLQKKLNPNVN